MRQFNKTKRFGYLFFATVFSLRLALPAPGRSQAYTVKPVSNGGTISGTVRFEGTPPKPRVITVTKDKAVARDASRQVDVVVVNDGKLAEAIVYLKKVLAGKEWPELPDGGMVDQKGARFIPHSRVIHKGMKVPVKNSDPVMHNIHAYELIGRARRTIFNKGQIKNTTLNLGFDVKRVPYVKIECDAHNFMHEYLFVASSPYYSVSGKEGLFEITDVPPGNYTLVVWHPVLGIQETKIQVAAGKTVTHDFTFKHDGGTK